MAKFDYSETAQDAYELIEEFGGDCTIKRNEGSYLDVDQPWLGVEESEVEYSCQGVLLSISARDYNQYDNLTTTGAQKKVLADAVELEIDPVIGDKIEVNGTEWFITALSELIPSDTTCLWTLFVKK